LRVVLMAPAFGFARRWPERLGAAAVEEWKRTGALEVFHYGEGRTRTVGYELLQDGARYEDYPEVTQPCLVFHGTHDDVVPAAYSQNFAEGRNNVQLHLMDSGHDLLNVLDAMAEAVQEFLARQSC
jgi:pimeloyl-ACP methyl ester carboxylesterase